MKFGVLHEFRNPAGATKSWARVYAEALEQITFAEQLGYHSVFIPEHHFIEDGYCPSLLTTLAAIAAKTSRIKLGTGVLLLTLQHPVRVAEDAAVVDIVSNGRLILGVGEGWREVEFENLGISMKQRKSRIEEGVEIIKRAWTEERFSFEGQRYALKNVSVTPKPVQVPRPPIWMGSASPLAIRRSAQMADARIASFSTPISRLKEQNEVYVAALRELGKDPAGLDFPTLRELYVAEDYDQAWEDVKDSIKYICQVRLGWGRFQVADPAGGYRDVTDPEDPALYNRDVLCKDRMIIGDPRYCVEEIKRYQREAGINHLILWTQFPGLAHEKVMASIDLFAKKVAPRLV